MTDFQISSNFHDLDWINKPSGSGSIWDNNFIPNPINHNNIKKNMILTNPNPITSPIGFNSGVQQPAAFDSTKVPMSVKSSEFINIQNSDLWSNNVNGFSNSSSNSSSNNISPNLNNSSGLLSPPQSSTNVDLNSPPSLSGSQSILPPIVMKRKGLIKAHSEDSLQPIQQQFLQQLQLQQQLQQQQDDENNANNGEADIEEEINGQSRYKTELCRSFAETGSCRYGIKCQFAHGKDEMRPVVRHPKYKTETCKTFHSTGSCPYGSRCRFIHISPNSSHMMVNAVDQNQLEVMQQQQHINSLMNSVQPIMTRQNSSPQLSQQHQQLQPLLLQLQQLKLQQSQQQQQPIQAGSLHHSQPIPKPTITWSNSWTSEEATTSAGPLKTPKKRLNVFKSFCTSNSNGGSNWN